MINTNKLLLVVDLQREFADIENEYEEYDKCISYVKDNKDTYDKIISTVFVNGANKNFKTNLDYDKCSDASTKSLEYLQYLDKNQYDVISKSGYGDAEITKFIKKYKRQSAMKHKKTIVHIIGCDLDACIMAVCFQLWDAKIPFKVLTRYCYTSANNIFKSDIIKILRRNFGKCIT